MSSRFTAVWVSTPSCTISWRYVESAPPSAVARSAMSSALLPSSGPFAAKPAATPAGLPSTSVESANDAASVPAKNWRPPTPSAPTAVVPSSVEKPGSAPVAATLQRVHTRSHDADVERASRAAHCGGSRIARRRAPCRARSCSALWSATSPPAPDQSAPLIVIVVNAPPSTATSNESVPAAVWSCAVVAIEPLIAPCNALTSSRSVVATLSRLAM